MPTDIKSLVIFLIVAIVCVWVFLQVWPVIAGTFT